MVLDLQASNNGEIIRRIGISDMVLSSHPNDLLITHSLGSCVGVTMYDPVLRLGGLIHCLLPQAKMNLERAKANPYMFVDSGVQELLSQLFSRGADKRRLIIKVAGAGQFLDQKKIFNVGERNYTVLRKVLWQNNLLIRAEEVGGTVPRTMTLSIKTGVTTIKSLGQERIL
ncbi:MAG: chemotaxis protein CheD [bacterium]|nr:chemotaxis protein CheD [bacterium]